MFKEDICYLDVIDVDGRKCSVRIKFQYSTLKLAKIIGIRVFCDNVNNPHFAELTIPDCISGNVSKEKYNVKMIGTNVFLGTPEFTANKLILGDGIANIMDGAFKGVKVKTIVWPKSCTKIQADTFLSSEIEEILGIENVTKIVDRAFSNCHNLKTFTWPNNCDVISSKIFQNCSSLKNISNLDNVISIRSSAFEGTALESFTIPGNCIHIGRDAFKDCRNLARVNALPADTITLSQSSFSNCDDVVLDFTSRTYITIAGATLAEFKEELCGRYVEGFYGFPIENNEAFVPF